MTKTKNMLEMAEDDFYGETLDVPVDTSSKWGGKIDEVADAEIYPNPVDDNLFVNLADLESAEVELTVYDLKGSIIIKRQDIANDGWHSVDVSTLKNGMYILEIWDAHRTEKRTVKFIKQ